jgi:hypothetical protein
MQIIDFEYDHHAFESHIRKVAFAYKAAMEKLKENFDHWSELGQEHLGGQLVVELKGDVLNGVVCGRRFSLSLAPIVVGINNHVLVILSVPDVLDQELIEIDRFLFTINGDVLSMEGQRIHTWDDDYQSYRLLIALSRAVLQAIPRRA